MARKQRIVQRIVFGRFKYVVQEKHHLFWWW